MAYFYEICHYHSQLETTDFKAPFRNSTGQVWIFDNTWVAAVAMICCNRILVFLITIIPQAKMHQNILKHSFRT